MNCCCLGQECAIHAEVPVIEQKNVQKGKMGQVIKERIIVFSTSVAIAELKVTKVKTAGARKRIKANVLRTGRKRRRRKPLC